MGRGDFVIQFSPELILQLAEEGDEKAERRSRQEQKAQEQQQTPFGMFLPPLPHHYIPTPPKVESREKPQAEAAAEKDVHAQPEEDVQNADAVKQEQEQLKQPQQEQQEQQEQPQQEKQQEKQQQQQQPEKPVMNKEIARDLKPLMEVLQKTEKHSEELQKKGFAELEEIKQRAKELQQKEHHTPLTRIAPCQSERDACIKCYREKDALQCSAVAAAYTQCTKKAMR